MEAGVGALKNVAVIGAGMAGLACAQFLQQAGYLVTVFEKSRGPSGRVSTRIADGWQSDHGAQYFTVTQPAFAAQLQQWLRAGVVAEWQGRLFETRGGQLLPKQSHKVRYVGVPANTAPAREIADNLVVAYEHTVTSIRMQAGKWHLTCKEHGVYPELFDQLVLAIPSQQAHVLLAAVHDPFATLAGGVKMRCCWALMARYAEWLDLPFDGLFVNNGPLSWVARDSSKPRRLPVNGPKQEVWVIHASAAWSETNIEREADAVAAEMMLAFKQLGGSMPAEYRIHRWRYADCADVLNTGFVWDADAQLGLCGDWLNGGKVEGAWMSGYLLAKMLANSTQFSR